MARRELLTEDARVSLFGVPTERAALARHYTLRPDDLDFLAARRGEANRLGAATWIALLRHPGFGLRHDEAPPRELVAYLADQLGLSQALFAVYGGRAKTRLEHVTRYTAAWADAERMGEQGLPILPHQRVAMQQAREGLDGVSPEATADLRSALSRNPGLAAQGTTPEGMQAVQRVMATERTVRLDPGARAERFVEDWRGLQAKRARAWRGLRDLGRPQGRRGPHEGDGRWPWPRRPGGIRSSRQEAGAGAWQGPRHARRQHGRRPGSIPDPWAFHRARTVARPLWTRIMRR